MKEDKLKKFWKYYINPVTGLAISRMPTHDSKGCKLPKYNAEY